MRNPDNVEQKQKKNSHTDALHYKLLKYDFFSSAFGLSVA